MKYIFYSTTAIPCETDLAKAKEKLSFLGKPKEYNCFHHDFKGFKIENIFNDNLFVEEINETIHFKCDVIILQFAFIYTQFQFEVSDSSSFGEILLNDEKGNNFYFKPREELKKIKIESLHDIQTKLLLFNFYNIESFQDNFKKFDVTLSLHQQAPIIKDAIKKHTLAIPSMFSTTISTSTGEIYIESNSREQTNLIINHKKLKVWKNNKQDDGSYFFNGDLEKLEEALIHYRITISLLYGHMYLLGAVLTDAAKASEDIQKNATLSAIINSGNAIAEFETKYMRDSRQAINEFKGEQRDLVLNIRKNGLTAVIGKSLEKTINETLPEEKLKDINRSDLYDQVNLTIKKIKRAFPNLQPYQEATLDVAIHKLLTKMGGYDGDGGWIPWDRADFPIMTIDKHSDMSKANVNELLDELKDYLPQKRDRTAGSIKAQAQGGELLEARISQYMEKNPLPVDFGQRQIESRTTKQRKIKAKYERLRKEGHIYDPEHWPELAGKALEWVKKQFQQDMIKAQKGGIQTEANLRAKT